MQKSLGQKAGVLPKTEISYPLQSWPKVGNNYGLGFLGDHWGVCVILIMNLTHSPKSLINCKIITWI